MIRIVKQKQWLSPINGNEPLYNIRGTKNANLPLTELGQQSMPLQTESTSALGKDWLRLPTSVSVRQSFSAAHIDFVSTAQCHAREQLAHELPVAKQQLI